MAQALRRSIAKVAVRGLLVIVILGPVVPGLFWALAPSFTWESWQILEADSQLPQALRVTLVSALLGTALGAGMAAMLAMAFYPGQRWRRLQRRLPLLLAVPHAAFAVGLFFLLSPSGWLARWVAPLVGWIAPPPWSTVQDPWGLSLALALGLKECWFLLWMLAALLGEQTVQRYIVVARSMGYSRAQTWTLVLWPQLLPRLRWPLAAVLTYGLSVVDMAIILGPSTPPTLAVLAWHWLTDPDPAAQTKGATAALVLVVLFVVLAAGVQVAWRAAAGRTAYPSGVRAPASLFMAPALDKLLFGLGFAVLGVLLLWSLADTWFFPALWPQSIDLRTWTHANYQPLATTVWLALAASLVCLPLALAWLEWVPRRYSALVYLPLVVPALPLVAAQYAVLLRVHGDGTALGLVWSHVLWVLPYMVLTLSGPYRAFDQRLVVTARSMGQTPLQACLRVKWPTLARPLLAAWAVGFAVSVAQYLPTLFAGGGRFETVTTQAVALSAGGDRRVLAVQALLQCMLPFLAFALASLLSHGMGRHRKGLR